MTLKKSTLRFRISIMILFLMGTGLLFGEKNIAAVPEIISLAVPVQAKSASLYAGPGTEHYVTGHLAQGIGVEIYFRTESGWCAIRPPQDSFSWVNARFVRKDYDNVGVITAESNKKVIPIRVGNDSVLKSTIIQVGLKNGDKVRILGEMTMPGGLTWYKISPPSGEFRWIHEGDLGNDPRIQQLPQELTFRKSRSGQEISPDTLQGNASFSARAEADPSYDASMNPDGYNRSNSNDQGIADRLREGSPSVSDPSVSNPSHPQKSGVPTRDIPISGIPNLGNRPASPDPSFVEQDFANLQNSANNQTSANFPQAAPLNSSREQLETSKYEISPEGLQIPNQPQKGIVFNEGADEKGDTIPSLDSRGARPVDYLVRQENTTPQRPGLPARSENPLLDDANFDYKFPLCDENLLDSNFYMEVSRLNRDLFLAIQNPTSMEIFELLAQRAITLNAVAQNDEQRKTIENLYGNIERCKTKAENGNLSPFQEMSWSMNSQEPSYSISQNGQPGYEYSTFENYASNPNLLNSYSNHRNSYNGMVTNSFPNGNQPMNGDSRYLYGNNSGQNDFEGATISFSPRQGEKSSVASSKAAPQKTKENRRRMSFAFANVRNPFKTNSSESVTRIAMRDTHSSTGTTTGARKVPSLLPEKRESLLIPPANYQAKPLINGTPGIAPANGNPSSAPMNGTSGQIKSDQNNTQKPASNTFWAGRRDSSDREDLAAATVPEDNAESKVNSVAAVSSGVTNQTSGNQTGSSVRSVSWQSPTLSHSGGVTGIPSSIPQAMATQNGGTRHLSNTMSDSWNSSSENGFDAFGILGCLPNRPEGYPAYVLVDRTDEPRHILCYVESESGRSIDQFVGKTIGIKGTRGWFQGGNENRRLITAKTIFSIP